MASSRRFALRLGLRLALLLVAASLAAALAAFVRAPTATLLAIGATGLVGLSLWRVVNESNVELARFVTALERADLGQSFRREGRGAGFDQLGSAYERALERLRGERASGAGAARFADALVDGAPTPLLVIGPADEVRFTNKAARRLFGRDEPCPLAALAAFGPPFVAALRDLAPGATVMSHLVLDGLSQRVALDATSFATPTGTRRVVAIKVVQVELDSAELAAQVDLVRVLTHEVMNSLTPVTSLAATASRLVGDLDPALAPGIGDAQLAIAALARRAGELERFVDSYKGFSEAPPLHRRPIDVAPWFAELAGLFAATPAASGVDVRWRPGDRGEAIDGDVGLLTQVMLNLLKNAGEAMVCLPDPRITVSAAPAANGRIKIGVADSGPGIDPALVGDVFLPFFTTKAEGTGIGLSFARQIVLLHGGQIGWCAGSGGDGGCFELLLPASAVHRDTPRAP